MIPVEAVIGLGIGIWYLIVSIVIFRNQRKQTELLKKILDK